MGEESSEMHPEDDKALMEKNKKRIVKTRSQVEALEKFYNEHKYPSESMKIQVAESIGLTEKQVSGWFCHRRLKDKKLMNGENYVTGRQDRSSGVVQDRASGHRQDSCGSTKQGDDRNFDTREVESGRFTSKEVSAADITYEHGSHYAGKYNRMDDASSGSSSSLRNHQNEGPFDAASSRYLIPKFPPDSDTKRLKTRSGPSGYLKVKGQVENAAVTAVKRQLGKHYREDGPPLGVEFDPLPPGAFESSMQDHPVEENYCTGQAVRIASPDSSNFLQNPKFRKASEYHSSIDGANSRMRRGSDSYIHQKSRMKTSFSNSGAFHPRSYASFKSHEGSARDIHGCESRDEYGSRHGPGFEVKAMDSVPGHPDLQPYGGKMREGRAESLYHKYNDVGTRVTLGENAERKYSNLPLKRNEYHPNSGEKGLSKEITKDGKSHPSRRIITENEVKVPFYNDLTGPRRIKEEFAQQKHLKTSPVVDDLPHTYQVIRSAREMPSSFSEDEESVRTSSSVD